MPGERKSQFLTLGVSDMKLTALFRAKTFCISKAQPKALVPKGWLGTERKRGKSGVREGN